MGTPHGRCSVDRFWPIPLILLLTAAGASSDEKLRRAVGAPRDVSTLPAHIDAPEDRLTLIADCDDVRGGFVVLYLVNPRSGFVSKTATSTSSSSSGMNSVIGFEHNPTSSAGV
jgi:hypothetical protein